MDEQAVCASRSLRAIAGLGVALLLAAVACTGAEAERGLDRRGTAPNHATRTPRIHARVVAAKPGAVLNGSGTSTAAAYDAISLRNTRDHPYGALTGGGTMAAIETPEELVHSAGAALLVEVTSLGFPYFNSDDGGYWIPDESQGNAALGIIQDVRVRVLDEWRDNLGLGQEFNLAVFGGQIEVTLTEEQARAAEISEGAGTYVYSIEPEIELSEGERALLFVARDQAAFEDGPREVVRVLGGFQGKVLLRDGTAVDSRQQWTMPVQDLRTLVERELGG